MIEVKQEMCFFLNSKRGEKDYMLLVIISIKLVLIYRLLKDAYCL